MHRCWMLFAAFMACLPGAALAQSGTERVAPTPVEQGDLARWWKAGADLWMGDTAYKAAGKVLNDGVCQATFDDGVLIPVLSGKPPLSERIVGFVFVGTGNLEVRFPERADAWRFANHMGMRGGRAAGTLVDVANQVAPYRVGIDRALFLSADPMTRELLQDLDPLGGGVILRDGKDGIDEEYVVTAHRGGAQARLVSTNLLPQRRLQLERAGVDPQAFLRQDRLIHEEFGLEGQWLRALADFRTTDQFAVAMNRKGRIGGTEFDRWMTCFRDGMDQHDTGYRSMAFAMGTDGDAVRHLERFSGEPITADQIKAMPRMKAIHAETEIVAKPVQRGNLREVKVKSTLTLQARGADMQYIGLSLPLSSTQSGSWELNRVALAEGGKVAWVGLVEGLHGRAKRLETVGQTQEDASETTDVESQTETTADVTGTTAANPLLGELAGGDTSSVPTGDGMGPQTPTTDNFPGSDGGPYAVKSQDISQQNDALNSETTLRYQVLVVLPEAVPMGEMVQLELHWESRWPFSNMTGMGQQLGPTTGPQPFLPELLPAPGGTAWSTSTTLGMPGGGLRANAMAVSGDTVKEWTADDGWKWVQAESVRAINPVVAIGRWQSYAENAVEATEHAPGSPGVKVHMFSDRSDALKIFPAEIRREVAFLERFLPAFPLQEIEVIQDASGTWSSLNRSRSGSSTATGVVTISQLKVTAVGQAGSYQEEDKHLEQTMLARQVADQYWGHLVGPLTARDSWATTALSDAYAAFYTRAAFGNVAYEERMASVRKAIEDPRRSANRSSADVNADRRFLSLSGSTWMSDVSGSMRANMGLYVMADMLRLRVGDAAYFATLDGLADSLAGRRVTTQNLQAAFERTTGEDLSDFFDYWVHGGFVPRLTLEWRRAPDRADASVVGCVVSDVPFGRFSVPVVFGATAAPAPEAAAEGKPGKKAKAGKTPKAKLNFGGGLSALVAVENGLGPFVVPPSDGLGAPSLDPMGMVVAYARNVKQVERTRCEQAGRTAG